MIVLQPNFLFSPVSFPIKVIQPVSLRIDKNKFLRNSKSDFAPGYIKAAANESFPF